MRTSSRASAVYDVTVRSVRGARRAPSRARTSASGSAAKVALPVDAAWAGHCVPISGVGPISELPGTSSRISTSDPVSTSSVAVSPGGGARPLRLWGAEVAQTAGGGGGGPERDRLGAEPVELAGGVAGHH